MSSASARLSRLNPGGWARIRQHKWAKIHGHSHLRREQEAHCLDGRTGVSRRKIRWIRAFRLAALARTETADPVSALPVDHVTRMDHASTAATWPAAPAQQAVAASRSRKRSVVPPLGFCMMRAGARVAER